MSTVRAIVNGSLRKLGRLGSGREARTVDAEDAFEALKGMYRAWINQGTFGRLWDVVPTADYTAYPGQRALVPDDAISITLPDLVTDWYWGCPWDFGSRWIPPVYDTARRDVSPPRDGSVIVVVSQTTGSMADFIYDGSIKQWVAVNGVIGNNIAVQPMALDSEAPLSVRDPQGLMSCLAIRISDEWGAEVQPATLRQAQLYEMALSSGPSNPQQIVEGCYY